VKAPPRLLDDPTVDSGLREDLDAASGAGATPYDAAAGLAGLQAAIEAGAPPSATGAEAAAGAGDAASAVSGATLAKLGVGVAVIAAAGALVLNSQPPGAPDAPDPVPAAVQAPSPQAPADAPPIEVDAPSEQPVPVVEQQVEQVEQVEQAEQHKQIGATEPGSGGSEAKKVARTRVPAVDPDAAMRREIAQLAEIRAALAGDPSRALGLAHRGHAQFGRGMLREEREGLAIMALVQLGRRDDAARRTVRFERRYPSSALLPRLRELQMESAP